MLEHKWQAHSCHPLAVCMYKRGPGLCSVMHAIALPEQVVEGLFSTVITCMYTPNVVPDGERGVAECTVVVLGGMRS